MSKINTPPLGLQSLLGSQSFGDNPDDLLQGVRPTVDMLPFYGVNSLKQDAATAARNTPGGLASFTYASGFTRMLLGVSVYAPTPVAGTYSTEAHILGFSGDGATYNFIIARDEPVVLAANSQYAWGYWLPQPIILEPDVTIAFRALQHTGGANVSFQCSYLYYELQT